MSNIPGLLGPPCGYIDLADAALVEKDEKRRAGPRTHNPLRPSASGFCARKLAHEYAEYKGLEPHTAEEQSPDLQRLFDLGHAVEYNMIRMWRGVEIFSIKYTQQAMTFLKYDGGIIEGSNDLCLYVGEHRMIADWKTKGDKWSSYRESKWSEIDDDLRRMKSVQVVNDRVYWVEDLPAFLDELKDEMFAHNFVQLNLYATNEFMVERGIDHACIFQYDKNKSRLREVRFKPSTKVRDYVLNKFTSIIEAVDVHKDPTRVEREAFVGSASCAFCPYAKRCWPELSEKAIKKEYYKTLPDKDWPRDTDRFDGGDEAEAIYAEYKKALEASGDAIALEDRLCEALYKAGVRKVRFSDNEVFETKFLKSPKPHYELRRSK